MKRKIIISGLICLAVAVIASLFTGDRANSYSQKSMEIINNLGKSVSYENMSANEIDDVIDYIEKNPEKVLPMNYMLISDYIYRLKKDEGKAIQYYYRGLIRVQEDIKMCKSQYARTFKNTLANAVEETQVIKIKIGMKNYWDIYRLYINELNWDETHKRYPNPYWACDIIGDDEGTVPLSEYQNVLKKYRSDMRNTEMWKDIVKEGEADLRENKTQYEEMIKEYLK